MLAYSDFSCEEGVTALPVRSFSQAHCPSMTIKPDAINWRKQSVWSGAGRFPPFRIPETDITGCEASKYATARQAMTEVSLELRARYGAWFRCAGDLRCGGNWRQLDPVGEFSKPMAPGPRSSIPFRSKVDG